MLDACRELGITLIAYSPLAMGALTGKYSAKTQGRWFFRRFLPNFSGKAMDAVQPVVQLLREIGERYSKEPQPGGPALADRKSNGAAYPRREEQPPGSRECRRAYVFTYPGRGRRRSARPPWPGE